MLSRQRIPSTRRPQSPNPIENKRLEHPLDSAVAKGGRDAELTEIVEGLRPKVDVREPTRGDVLEYADDHSYAKAIGFTAPKEDPFTEVPLVEITGKGDRYISRIREQQSST